MHVLGEGHVGALLKLHVVLLSLIHSLRDSAEEVEGCGETVAGLGGKLRYGHRQQGVAREDGLHGTAAGVYRGAAVAGGAAVHHIVVDEGEVVKHLHGDGLVQGGGGVGAECGGRHQCQQGAQALASAVEGVCHRLVERAGRLWIRKRAQGMLDGD